MRGPARGTVVPCSGLDLSSHLHGHSHGIESATYPKIQDRKSRRWSPKTSLPTALLQTLERPRGSRGILIPRTAQLHCPQGSKCPTHPRVGLPNAGPRRKSTTPGRRIDGLGIAEPVQGHSDSEDSATALPAGIRMTYSPDGRLAPVQGILAKDDIGIGQGDRCA